MVHLAKKILRYSSEIFIPDANNKIPQCPITVSSKIQCKLFIPCWIQVSINGSGPRSKAS